MVIAGPIAPSSDISDTEIAAILEQQAQASFGTSADDFLKLWRAGKIEHPDRPAVIDFLLLVPGAR